MAEDHTTLEGMFEAMGMNRAMAALLTASWAVATQKQYTLVLKRWTAYCVQEGINPRRPSLQQGIDYLQALFTGGVARNSINTVRSMLSTFVMVGGKPFEEHPLVSRLLKGISNLKPPAPKYSTIWDPKQLLDHIQGWGPVELLDTDKLMCLYLLATGQ